MKMNRHFTFAILLNIALLISACSIKNNPKEYRLETIDIEATIDSKTKTSTLEEFIDRLNYIPLETKQECLIDDIQKLAYYEGNIFVMDQYGIYKFNRTGKFICKFGTRGRGPKENSIFANFFIKSDTIYLRGWNKINAYDTNSGNFLYSIHFDDKYPRIYINKTEKNFVSFNYSNNQIEFYDVKGNVIDSTIYFINNKMILDRAITFSYYNLFFGTDKSLKFTTYCNDTIFEVNEKFNLIPKYIINLGKYKIPEKYRPDVASWDLFYNNASFYLRKILLETSELILIQLGHWRKSKEFSNLLEYSDEKAGISGLAIYNKNNKKLSLIRKDEENFPCFYPNFSDGENHLLTFVNPIDVISVYNQYTHKYQINNSFIRVAKDIKVDDNPIIIIADLKD